LDWPECSGELTAPITAAVVGEHPLDDDAEVGEEGVGSPPEGRRGDGLLVGEYLGVGETAEAVHRRVHEGEADLGVMMLATHRRFTVDPPAATPGDAAQLLGVDMDQLARPGHLHAPDRLARDPIEMVEAVEPVANQHPMHGRGRHSDDASNAGRPQAPLRAQADDSSLLGRLGPSRRAMRAAGAILEAGHALGLVATPPDIGPVPRDVHRLGGVRHRPTGFDSLTEPVSTFGGERGVTVHRSLRCEWVSLADPHSLRRLHSLVDPVSKVRGRYS
jgi:hypothetical protein